VVTFGYGLMPSYSSQLTQTERWGVVAYLRALQLSQRAVVSQLPSSIVADLRREAP
jgi:hypothetical protein